MGEMNRDLLERKAADERLVDAAVDALVRKSVELYDSPSEIFSHLAIDVPDDELLAFVKLVESVNRITSDHLYATRDDKCRSNLLEPDLTRAVLMTDGSFKVPVADRHSLQRFLKDDDVDEALDTYYLQNLQRDEEDSDEEDEVESPASAQAVVVSKINELPTTEQTLDTDMLLAIAGAFYWSDKGDEKYINPADTLEDIARNAPPEMIIPLILTLEKRFPKVVDEEGCYIPVIDSVFTKGYRVEDGVVWCVYSVDDLRGRLRFACEADEAALKRFYGVDGNRFDEAFIDTLFALTRNEIVDFENPAVEAFMNEQNRRDEVKYGWLYRIGTKA